MGIAAYSRGSRLVSRQIDEASPSALATLLGDLTRHSAAGDGQTLYVQTIVRRAEDGRWWLMGSEDKGWASYGRPFGSLWVAARAFRMAFVGAGQDASSVFLRVVPMPRIAP